ncbi:MAG: hypothetical protein HKN47_00740 [Pirellulaceae bacterium]|nr:hypothetical protein [Pirellulaceae bacterium]
MKSYRIDVGVELESAFGKGQADMLSLIGKRLEQGARQSRFLYRFPKAIDVRNSWRELSHEIRPRLQNILLDLRSISLDGEQGRRFHAMVMMLDRVGYGLWMVPRIRFLQSGHKCFKWQALQHVQMHRHGGDDHHSGQPPHYDLCLRDRGGDHPLAVRTIQLTQATYRGLGPNETDLPYGMHPEIYNSQQDLQLASLRQTPRNWELFFGGYRSKEAYRAKSYYKYVHTVNRYELTQCALQIYGAAVRSPRSDIDLEQLIGCQDAGFVFIDNHEYRIPITRWLDTLSRSRFFLAAPGTTYPMSHNCVESLAVGTIPVLEYPQVFRPALQDGVNCLTYRGIDGFRDLLSRLHQIDSHTVASLRRGAADYYDRHLGPAALAERLKDPMTKRLHAFAHLAKPAE